jgi:two-component system phosphate regulon sensor histidine kinase PhoR
VCSSDLAVALGDAALLTHVFQNLIQNAICYNKENGEVAVRIFREDEWIGVSIADTGIGISPDHLPRIFERFYRVDRSRSRQSGGCGLGLSIAEHIVQLHGGRIEAQSTPGMGSTFTVRLRWHYRGSSFMLLSPDIKTLPLGRKSLKIPVYSSKT